MRRLLLIISIPLTIAACSANSSRNNTNSDSATAAIAIHQQSGTTNKLLTDTTKVKAWLIGVIEDYANSQDPQPAVEDLKRSLTDDYYHYKQDAINLEYDNGDPAINEEAFKKKWQDEYNIKYVGNGGFLISAQDNSKIKVTSCHFIKELGQDASIYKVLIEDLDFKAGFNRDIKVVTKNNKLFIDDVIEYN